MKQWLPRSFHEKCRDFCEKNWAPSLEIGKWWELSTYLTVDQITGNNPMGGLLHPYKGRHAPGHSIVPNLLIRSLSDAGPVVTVTGEFPLLTLTPLGDKVMRGEAKYQLVWPDPEAGR